MLVQFLMKHNKNSVKLADVPATNKINACFNGTRCLENRSVIASKIIQPNKYWLPITSPSENPSAYASLTKIAKIP